VVVVVCDCQSVSMITVQVVDQFVKFGNDVQSTIDLILGMILLWIQCGSGHFTWMDTLLTLFTPYLGKSCHLALPLGLLNEN